MVEFLTKVTVWLAMLGWVSALVAGRFRLSLSARILWTSGLVCYLLHILFAYEAFYDWSNKIAWEQTAADTERLTGVRSGAGLLVNFLFLGFLTFDICRQWFGRMQRAGKILEVFVVFMIFNGAVVFGSGAVRWFGVALLMILFGAYFFLHGAGTRENSIRNE